MKRRMTHFIFISSIWLLIFIMPEGRVFADEIVLENGNILTGTVVKVEGGKLTLKTDFSQPVEIQMDKIKKITTDNPVEVHLTTGEIIKGKLKTAEDGRMVIEPSPERGATRIEAKEIASVNPPPKPPVKLTGSITLGGNHQSGNTDRAGASVAADASLKTDLNRFSLRFLYNYAKESGQETTNNTYGLLKYDYFFTKKFYGYLASEFLKDRFKDLNLRTIVGPGVGYQVWDDPGKFLSLEGGVAYESDDYITAKDQSTVTARLAADFRYKLFEFVIFGDRLEVFPNLNYGGEYKLRNEASIQSPLGAGWALKLSNIIEQNSDPSPGFKKTDTTWILGLQYSF